MRMKTSIVYFIYTQIMNLYNKISSRFVCLRKQG